MSRSISFNPSHPREETHVRGILHSSPTSRDLRSMTLDQRRIDCIRQRKLRQFLRDVVLHLVLPEPLGRPERLGRDDSDHTSLVRDSRQIMVRHDPDLPSSIPVHARTGETHLVPIPTILGDLIGDCARLRESRHVLPDRIERDLEALWHGTTELGFRLVTDDGEVSGCGGHLALDETGDGGVDPAAETAVG